MRRTGQPREIPPPLEMECLKALWTLGEASVKSVREIVTQRRNLAYTTVMTVLDRLVRRGGVARRKDGRSFVYAPQVRRETLQRMAVQELADSLFEGSPHALARFIDCTDWSSVLGSDHRNPEAPAVRLAAVAFATAGPDTDRAEQPAASEQQETEQQDHLDAALL
jgi:predicted transcriptional regulator